MALGRALLLSAVLLAASSSPPPQKRVAVIIRGESFRTNSHQGSRETGVAGYDSQREASRNHVERMLQPLVHEFNYSGVDVHLECYTTPFDDDLASWYGGFLVSANFTPKLPGDDPIRTMPLRNGVLPRLLRQEERYAAIMIFRPDLLFKPAFRAALAHANRSQFLFTFMTQNSSCCDFRDIGPDLPPYRHCVTGCNKRHGTWAWTAEGNRRVSDMWTWTPAWAFSIFRGDNPALPLCMDCLFHYHDAVDYLNVTIGNANVEMLLPSSHHDADPAKDANPLYALANRREEGEVNSVRANYSWWKGELL